MRVKKLKLQYVFSLLLLFLHSAQALETPCLNSLCQLATDGAYENLIVGKLVHVASDTEFQQVFDWAKSQEKWQHLPTDFAHYQQSVKLVSIQFSDTAQPVSVFLTKNEYDAAPFEPGAMVRYRPHNNDWEAPQNEEERTLFYELTGCVATICAASDQPCQARYVSGVFNLTGQAIQPFSNAILSPDIIIDPVSLLPSKEAN
ncbi:MAG: hypothetical protein WAO12_09985 [Venatoribacter sp.]